LVVLSRKYINERTRPYYFKSLENFRKLRIILNGDLEEIRSLVGSSYTLKVLDGLDEATPTEIALRYKSKLSSITITTKPDIISASGLFEYMATEKLKEILVEYCSENALRAEGLCRTLHKVRGYGGIPHNVISFNTYEFHKEGDTKSIKECERLVTKDWGEVEAGFMIAFLFRRIGNPLVLDYKKTDEILTQGIIEKMGVAVDAFLENREKVEGLDGLKEALLQIILISEEVIKSKTAGDVENLNDNIYYLNTNPTFVFIREKLGQK
jgi:hypothetical protein